MPTLTITEGPHRGTELTFKTSAVLGRGAAADLSIPDPGLSRRHAKLTWDGTTCRIEDLGSANGTSVNGSAITAPTALADGDAIEVGFLRAVYAAPKPARRKPAQSRERRRRAIDQSTTEVVATLAIDSPEAIVETAGDSPDAATSALQARFVEGVGRIGDMVFDQQALIEFVARELLALLDSAERVFVMLADEDAPADPSGQPALVRAAVHGRNVPRDATPSQTLLEGVIAKREARLVVDAKKDQAFARAESMHGVGITTAIGVPVIFRDRIYGALQIDGRGVGLALKPEDLVVAVSLAAQLGMALGYARLHAELVAREVLEHDLQLATRLQQQFLPQVAPDLPGYTCRFESRAAQAVGGDFYDFLSLDEGRVGIVVGDVSGKGVSAALYAAKLTSDLRHQAVGQTSPAAILERTNRLVADAPHEGMFATAAVIVMTPADGRLDVASAGHPLPLIRNRSGDVRSAGRMGNMPLGVDGSAEFEDHREALAPSDTLVLYTDGVTEALDEQALMFGDRRLRRAFARHGSSPDALMDGLRRELRRFTGSAPQSDDVTMLCVQRRARARA